MPVIPVNREVDKKIMIGKMDGRGGIEAHGVTDPKKKEPGSVVEDIDRFLPDWER
jgi:hypothetical protein